MRNIIDRLLNWYFRRESLPYWCIFLLDSLLLFLSGFFTYWLFHKTNVLVELRFEVLYTMLVYVVFGWVGFRLFHTYSGIVRFSSFVDLMRVGYGAGVSMLLALVYSVVMESQGLTMVAALNQTETVITFVMATLVMWMERILVKTLYDISFSSKRAKRVLIYGAMTGGIGLAKNITTQRPRRYLLRGFISHDNRAHHMMLMGRKVYNVNDDLGKIIDEEGIEAILVSPLRNHDFQSNQELQDLLISKGVKI